MQFAEPADHVLRPELDRAGAAGMEPARRARNNLQARDRGPEGGEKREGVALHVVDGSGARRNRPVAPHAVRASKPRRTPVAAIF